MNQSITQPPTNQSIHQSINKTTNQLTIFHSINGPIDDRISHFVQKLFTQNRVHRTTERIMFRRWPTVQYLVFAVLPLAVRECPERHGHFTQPVRQFAPVCRAAEPRHGASRACAKRATCSRLFKPVQTACLRGSIVRSPVSLSPDKAETFLPIFVLIIRRILHKVYSGRQNIWILGNRNVRQSTAARKAKLALGLNSSTGNWFSCDTADHWHGFITGPNMVVTHL